MLSFGEQHQNELVRRRFFNDRYRDDFALILKQNRENIYYVNVSNVD